MAFALGFVRGASLSTPARETRREPIPNVRLAKKCLISSAVSIIKIVAFDFRRGTTVNAATPKSHLPLGLLPGKPPLRLCDQGSGGHWNRYFRHPTAPGTPTGGSDSVHLLASSWFALFPTRRQPADKSVFQQPQQTPPAKTALPSRSAGYLLRHLFSGHLLPPGWCIGTVPSFRCAKTQL